MHEYCSKQVSVIETPKYIFLGGTVLEYVDKFSYLGHIICNDFYDDDDIKKETRNLCARGNALIRTFGFCNLDVKCRLFMSFCYTFYCGTLWSVYRAATLTLPVITQKVTLES